MTDTLRTAYESFLVEDVILTLGNLRGSLDWMGTDIGGDPEKRRAGIDRIDRQIVQLEDRARDVCRLLHEAGYHTAKMAPVNVGADQTDAVECIAPMMSPHAAPTDKAPLLLLSPPEPEALVPAGEDPAEPDADAKISLETAILDALSGSADEEYVTLPVFQSKRA